MKEILSALKDISPLLGPALGALAVVIGTLLTCWSQGRGVRRQAEMTHRQNLELLRLEMHRDEKARRRQQEEADLADRLRVIEYVDMLVPRMHEIAAIRYLADDNKDEEEGEKYRTLKRYISIDAVSAAHPEQTLGLRISFLIFQLIAAMRLAILARWTRPLSDAQSRFLGYWELDIEPILCSGRYPGKEFLYREQLEIVAHEMITPSSALGVTRPLNWSEFCNTLSDGNVLGELARVVAEKIAFVFDESNPLPARKATQCRLAIMGLYFAKLSEEAGESTWSAYVDRLWQVVLECFQHEKDCSYYSGWFVFERGDVEERAKKADTKQVQ